jgi:hypothetical protein
MAIEWFFPGTKIYFMKIEIFTLTILSLLVFFFTFAHIQDWVLSLTFAVFFIAIYFAISYLSQFYGKMEEKYNLTSKHLQITRKTMFKTKQEKVLLKKISFFKLDKFFLGGYAISNQGRHPIAFNTRKELDKFAKHLKKYVKI